MQLPRFYNKLEKVLQPGKVLVIFGPRQVGKTTLITKYLKSSKYKYRLVSGDDVRIQEVMQSSDLLKLKEFASGFDLIAVDEAQRIKNVGMALKLMIDHIPGLRIIASGSSSFGLAGQVGEPLTGRKRTLILYPIAQLELTELAAPFDLKTRLDDYLVFGTYPEILTAQNREVKIRLLNELSGSYIFKDILELEKVKGAKVLLDLLRLLAFQIGKEVSLNELAKQLAIDAKTVGRYIDLFEKAFVLYNLRGFSRNLRKEITKKSKYYFYDTGLRNAIISNFNPLDLRNDVGELWENFIMIERLKKRSYHQIYANPYFWRTWTQQEVDLIEEREGLLFGYEFKWGKKLIKPPLEFLNTYPEAKYSIINIDNYLDFIT